MHSSHHRSRGHKRRSDDEDALVVTRVDDYDRDDYSRSHQYSYRSSPPEPSSSAFGMGRDREAVSSRGRRDEEDWRPNDSSRSSHRSREKHSYSRESDRHGTRDEYDSRDTEAWSRRSPPGHSSRDWSGRYDRAAHPDAGYGESSSWKDPAPYAETDVHASYNNWTNSDKRHYDDSHGRSRDGGRNRIVSEGDSLGWQPRGDHRDSDQGWEPRRRAKTWEETRGSNDAHRDDSRQRGGRREENRSWEPAPGWQDRDSRGKHHYPSKDYSPRKDYPDYSPSKGDRWYKSKSGKKKSKQKRDWREDDGDLNNWQRRDVQPSHIKKSDYSGSKHHQRSLSRSRSPSPLPSHRSKKASRGRSRSRSMSPKRKGKDLGAERGRSPSPRNEYSRKSWPLRPPARYSRSPPSPDLNRGAKRRRSLSANSLSSRSRSVSRSPEDRPKVPHRLPTATNPTKITWSASRQPISLSHGPSKLLANDASVHQNGKTNGSSANQLPLLTPRPATNASPRGSLDSPIVEPSASVKGAGFKPIGQASSAVKRFFPADDDDSDPSPPPQKARIDQPPQATGLSTTSVLPERPPTLPARPSALPDRHPSLPEPPARSSDRSDRVADESRSPHAMLLDRRNEAGAASSLAPPKRIKEIAADLGVDSGSKETSTTSPTTTPNLKHGETGAHLAAHGPSHVHERHSQTSSPRPRPDRLYAIVSQVGEGTFGKVFKAQNTVTKVNVALKRIRMEAERDGFPVTAMREIKLLQSLAHPNIIRLYEMMMENGSASMVFEYMDHDLTGVLGQSQYALDAAHLKSLCHQMLSGLAYLHHKGVIHRDMKGSNILINNRGELKLGDFGLARFYQKRRQTDYTNRVITLWYRPPELLFGATVYGPEVDMWSAGCIMLELFTKKPVLQGNDEIHQLETIYKIFGTPTPERWPGLLDLPWYELIKPKMFIPNRFRELFNAWLSPAGLDLAEKLLAYDPTSRISAAEAMEAPYFLQEDPQAILPVGLATVEGEWHELEVKREREKAKKRRKTEPAAP